MTYTRAYQKLIDTSVKQGVSEGLITEGEPPCNEIDWNIIEELEKLKNAVGYVGQVLNYTYLFYAPTKDAPDRASRLEYIKVMAGDSVLLYLSADDVSREYDCRPRRPGMDVEDSHTENCRIACEQIRNWVNVRST